MATIDSSFSERAIERWSKYLAEQAVEPLWFKPFLPEPKPLSLAGLLIKKIVWKFGDIKFACGIIFKGKDPYDY